MEPLTTVWLIEDNDRYRHTLQFAIDQQSDLACPVTFGAVEDALEADVQADGEPDVLLLDVNLPGMTGIEGLGQLKAKLPMTRIVMLTINDDTQTLFDALRAGASGYLLKNAPMEQIFDAIREAQAGGTLMPAPVAEQVLRYFQQAPAQDYGLTDREKEVLRAMTAGKTQKQIAAALFVSPNTVNNHIQRIYEKLHVHSGIEAVAKAIRERLV